MTFLRMQRQLGGPEDRAAQAVSLAHSGRQAIEGAIEDLQQQIEAVRTGCVDFDLGDVLAKTEVRLLHLLRELERFEREVTQPAEELQRSSVRFSDASADFRTNVSSAP